MRIDSQALNIETTSSGAADRLEINAWRDGELVAEHLPVGAFTIGWDTGRQVQGQISATINDPAGTLAPWAVDDALGPGGSQLQVTWISGASQTECPLGWWRIRAPKPREQWQVQRNAAGEKIFVPGGGGRVVLEADELTCIPATLDRLDAEAVPAGATCLGEVDRLLDGIMGVDIDDTIDDRSVPVGLVYGESRMDAIDDHLARVDARHRMGPGGQLEVVPITPAEPVWTIEGGDTGVLIDFDRSMNDEGLYNAVISTATDAAGNALVGRAYLDGGPLAYGGPFGRRPLFHQSIATTLDGVQQDAQTMLTNRQAAGEVVVSVTALLHPGLQLHDWVLVVPPSLVGGLELLGRVTSMSMASAGDGLVSRLCSLGVAVSIEDLAALAVRARG